jgi:multiple sugar transport system permease protein
MFWPSHLISRHLFLTATSCAMLAPFATIVAMSFSPPTMLSSASPGLSSIGPLYVGNYLDALSKAPVSVFLLNGIVCASAIAVLQVVLALPLAYALAKLPFFGRRTLLQVVIAGLMVPSQVLALPLFVMCYQLGLLNSYSGLILPWGFSTFAVFLFRQFLMTIPDDLIHAARIDGFCDLGIIFRILLPLLLPSVLSFFLFSFITHWNDLFWPMIVVNDERLATPPAGLVYFRNAEAGNDYGPLAAATVIITAPICFLFLLFQKHFVRGVASTGLK